MILITTAGKVGSEAARLLAQRDASVRVLVRDHEKAITLWQLGVQVAEGDLDDSASLDVAMRGVTFSCAGQPSGSGSRAQRDRQCGAAGVGHVVKITSKASVGSPIARQRGQAEIEAGLIASGLNYTLLRNNFYICWPRRSRRPTASARLPATGRSALSIRVMSPPWRRRSRLHRPGTGEGPTCSAVRNCSPTLTWRRRSPRSSDGRSRSTSAPARRTHRR